MKMDFRFIIGLLISIVLYYTIGGIVFTSLYFIMISMFVLGVAYITVFSGKVSGKLIYMKDRYEVFETGKLNLQIYNDSRLFCLMSQRSTNIPRLRPGASVHGIERRSCFISIFPREELMSFRI